MCGGGSITMHSRQCNSGVSNEMPRLNQQMIERLNLADSIKNVGEHDAHSVNERRLKNAREIASVELSYQCLAVGQLGFTEHHEIAEHSICSIPVHESLRG